MGEQGIAAVNCPGDGVLLVLFKLNLRVHASQNKMAPVVFPGPYAVHLIVVFAHQLFTAVRVPPYPVLERQLEHGLLLLGKGRFLGIKNTPFIAVPVCYGIVNLCVLQIQRVLQQLIGADPRGAVGTVRRHIVLADMGPVADIPGVDYGRILHMDLISGIARGPERFVHELPDVLRVHPIRTQPDGNFRSVQVPRLYSFQGADVDLIGGVSTCRSLRYFQLLPDIAGEVFVCGLVHRRFF